VKEQGIPYFYDVIDDPDGHWVYDPAKGNLKKAIRLALRRRLPHRAAAEGPHAPG